MICPVTKFEAVRKKTTASEISSPVPARPAGVLQIIRSTRSSTGPNGITPGATLFTVIAGAKALASAFVNIMTPAFEAQ